jgi:hypothetical protein
MGAVGQTINTPGRLKMGDFTWDVFISHASEDKETAARPLTAALEQRGVRVWLNENTMRVG